MIVHVFPGGAYFKSFYSFIRSRFSGSTHVFLVTGYRSKLDMPEEMQNDVDIVLFNKMNLFKAASLLNKASKIYFHGFFPSWLFLIFYLVNIRIFKKSQWVVWGGDAYFKLKDLSFKNRLLTRCQHVLKSRFSQVSTIFEGEFYFTKETFNIRCQKDYIPARYVYFQNSQNLVELANNQSERYTDVINVQVGNSASISNNYEEIINFLAKQDLKGFKFFFMLSYGDKAYAEQIIKKGKVLGDSFEAVTKYLPLRDYYNHLSSMDIFLFNHDRQQALSNIFTVLLLKKKLYIRSDNLFVWRGLQNLNIQVFDVIDLISSNSLRNIQGQAPLEENAKIVADYVSHSTLERIWKQNFENYANIS